MRCFWSFAIGVMRRAMGVPVAVLRCCNNEGVRILQILKVCRHIICLILTINIVLCSFGYMLFLTVKFFL